ncbi:MAG: O-methyltransferase [Bacteroides sp.]|nr:O-methyltransferase [Bacteroides sp.]
MTEELEDYIDAHIEPEPRHLLRLERRTNLRLVNGRMCSGHLQGRLLKMLVRMIRPQKVLELGTFSGYSALCMAEGLMPEGKIVTLEAVDELEDFIRENLSDAGELGEKVELRIGPALQTMAGMPDASFDLIFMDADKREYPAYFREAMRLTVPGGFIIADNTLWDGHVADPDRNDPQTAGIKNFNDLVASDPRCETVILPVRDGLTLIYKKPAPLNSAPTSSVI